MSALSFELPDGTVAATEVTQVFNAGWAGRDRAQVQAHIDELAELGVPAPERTPCLYPVSPYLARQTSLVRAQHARTSGEAEWALVVTGPGPGDVLLTSACDHTDRELEVHGVAWSKNAAPDVLARRAWRLSDVLGHVDDIRIVGRVGRERALIQDGTCAELLPPTYWLDVLKQAGLYRPGTVLLSGTIPMMKGPDQFASRWETALVDPVTGEEIVSSYDVEVLPAPL
ncbi:DUF2848 domain-containing protein [Microbispora sp. NPDC046933]|uniref:DUF2848 domain-containing protein n=1 Tax=Microbispora sp. NPDC046933 TaxID=3155618 RepID=UPI00340225DA